MLPPSRCRGQQPACCRDVGSVQFANERAESIEASAERPVGIADRLAVQVTVQAGKILRLSSAVCAVIDLYVFANTVPFDFAEPHKVRHLLHVRQITAGSP